MSDVPAKVGSRAASAASADGKINLSSPNYSAEGGDADSRGVTDISSGVNCDLDMHTYAYVQGVSDIIAPKAEHLCFEEHVRTP